MATPLRKQSLSVKERLFQEPFSFSFSQAVMLLETLYGDKDKVSTSPRADQEAIRFSSNILLSTPPSDIYGISESNLPHIPSKLTINFLGIAGQTGPLPHVYGELIIDRVRRKDYAFRDFLDSFNNRLAGLNYRIRVKHTLSLQRVNPAESDVGKILSFFGGKPEDNMSAPNIDQRSYLKYAGLLYQNPRSAVSLEVMLRDYFQLPFSVSQFQGFWTYLDDDQVTRIGPRRRRTAMGTAPQRFGQQNVLGSTAVLGTKAWIHGEHVSLGVEGLSLDNYLDLLPDRDLNKTISEMTRQYLGRSHFFSFELGLGSSQSTPTRLDGKSALGWTSWLKEAPQGYTPPHIRVKANDPLM